MGWDCDMLLPTAVPLPVPADVSRCKAVCPPVLALLPLLLLPPPPRPSPARRDAKAYDCCVPVRNRYTGGGVGNMRGAHDDGGRQTLI